MSKQYTFFILPLLVLAVCVSSVAAVTPAEDYVLNVSGKWQVSWQARLGTEQATIELQQDGSKLRGTFHDLHHSCLCPGQLKAATFLSTFSLRRLGPTQSPSTVR